MKQTKHGIKYIEESDYIWDATSQAEEMALSIDVLFDRVFERLEQIEEKIDGWNGTNHDAGRDA